MSRQFPPCARRAIRRVSPFVVVALISALGSVCQAGPITVLADYRLGNADPGAATGGAVNNPTVDSSGNGHNLAPAGTVTYTSGWPFDPTDLAASFGGNGYISGSEIGVGTDNFGIEAWIRPTSVVGGRVIAYNGRTDTTGFGLYQAGDQFAFLYGGNVLQNVATVTPGDWVYLALVRDGGTTKFFLNGTSIFSSGDGPNPLNGGGGMAIAANHVGTENFIGDISEVRLFTFKRGEFDSTDLLQPVPEPATLMLLGGGLAGLIVRRRVRARC